MSKFITVPMIKGNLISINVDRILYAYPDGEKETIVDYGGNDFVAVALSFEDFSKLIYAAEDEVLTAVIDSTVDDEPKPYTGYAECADVEYGFTMGRIYYFANGYTCDDNGKLRPNVDRCTVQELNEWFDENFMKQK